MSILKIILGSLLISVGLFFSIVYGNLLVSGYSFGQYLMFLIKRGIILWFLGGLIIIYKGMRR